MQFPLPDGYGAACTRAVLGFERLYMGFQFGQVMNSVVGDAEGPDLSSFLRGEQRVPSAEAGGTAAVGSVD